MLLANLLQRYVADSRFIIQCKSCNIIYLHYIVDNVSRVHFLNASKRCANCREDNVLEKKHESYGREDLVKPFSVYGQCRSCKQVKPIGRVNEYCKHCEPKEKRKWAHDPMWL